VTIAFKPEYVGLLDGDVPAALMLNQILFWYALTPEGKPKLRVFKDHMFWIAKSWRDWNDELGLSRKQVRRCLDVLQRTGLIETRLKMFNAAPTIHLRLKAAEGSASYSDVQALLNHRFALEGKSICPVGQNHLPYEANPFALEGQSITESTSEKTTDCNTVLTHDTKMVFLEKPKDTQKTEEKMPNTDEIVKNRLYGNKGKKSVLNHWQSKMATYTGAFQVALNKKDANQLKMFQELVGEKAFEAIDFAFDHWYEFMQQVKLSTGYVNLPGVPSLSYVLKYRQQLLNCMQSIAQPLHTEKTEVKHIGVPIPKIVKEKGYIPPEVLELEKALKVKKGFG
jgi:hypothetical protein